MWNISSNGKPYRKHFGPFSFSPHNDQIGRRAELREEADPHSNHFDPGNLYRALLDSVKRSFFGFLRNTANERQDARRIAVLFQNGLRQDRME